jgi:cytochrome c peroxidase
MKTYLLCGIFVTAIVLVGSCKKDVTAPIVKQQKLQLPLPNYGYIGNPNYVNLGRVLFYDTQLSLNNSVACASCHKQEFAFADNKAFSRGFQNEHTSKHTIHSKCN